MFFNDDYWTTIVENDVKIFLKIHIIFLKLNMVLVFVRTLIYFYFQILKMDWYSPYIPITLNFVTCVCFLAIIEARMSL